MRLVSLKAVGHHAHRVLPREAAPTHTMQLLKKADHTYELQYKVCNQCKGWKVGVRAEK